MARPSKTIECYGHALTLKDLAAITGKGIEAIRVTINAANGNADRFLQRCGITDEMELLARMNEIEVEAEKTANAVDEIVGVIAESNPDIVIDEVKEVPATAVSEVEAPNVIDELELPPLTERDKERMKLGKVNMVIRSLKDEDVRDALDSVDIDPDAIICELERGREKKFIHLVDWERVEYGY